MIGALCRGQGFNVRRVQNLVLWKAYDRGVTKANATLSANVAGYTASNATAVVNGAGYRITATSTTSPQVTGTPTSAAIDSVGQPPIVFRWQFQYTSGQVVWVLVETSSTGLAANRTWFRIDGSAAVGTSGSAHSSVSIGALDGDGRRTATLTVNSNATASVLRFRIVDGDNSTTSTGTNGLYFDVFTGSDLIDQPRYSSANNKISAVAWPQATVNDQPGIDRINGRQAIRSYVSAALPSQYVMSSEAACLIATGGAYTAIAVVHPRGGIGVAGFYCQGSSASTSRRIDMLRVDTASRLSFSTANDAAAAVTVTSAPVANDRGSVIVSRCDGANITGRVDELALEPSTPAAFGSGARTPNRSGILCSPRSTLNLGTNGAIGEILLANRALTDAEMTLLVNGLRRKWRIANNRAGILTFEGDSITAGAGLTTPERYPDQALALLGSNPYWVSSNVATSGHTLAQMTSDAAAQVDPLFSPGAWRNILVVFGGTNDIATGGASGETAYNRLVTYCQARKTANPSLKIVTGSMLPRTAGITGSPPGGFEVNRQTFNTSLLANWATFADALFDCGNAPLLSDPSNATYYQDQIHPTAAGAAVIAGLAATAIQSLY